MSVVEQLADPLVGTYRADRPTIVSGNGCRVCTENGQELLDLVSGIGVNALGYGNPLIAAAIESALATGLIHTSNLYRNEPAQKLAALLSELSFAEKVFFCNSGAEANEAAFKFARRYARELGAGEKHEIIALNGSFHGRLFGSLAATDREAYRAPFEPLMPGVRFVAPGDVQSAAQAISSERTAAIIAEPVQGEGGVQPLDRDYLAALRELADAAHALLIFDEVQCGLGRTGSLFAYEQFGVEPDLLTLAKPLAGGLPMGAVLVSEKVAAAMKPGDHATTFGGGVLVATVAHAVVQEIANPAFLADVRSKAHWLEQRLRALALLPIVRDVRGMGLLWGIELDRPAAPFVARAQEAGVLLTSAGERVIRMLPPLVISRGELEEGVYVLEQVLQ